jgi:hypothetical protein
MTPANHIWCFLVSPCPAMSIRGLARSPSHLKLFDAGKSSVSLVDFALRGLFFFASSAVIRLSLGDAPS